MPCRTKSGGFFVVVLIFSGLLAGCAGRSITANPGQKLSVGSKIDVIVKAQMVQQQTPGLSLAVVSNGIIIYARGYGTANLELGVPAASETVYALGSITKQFTASAI